MISGGEIVFQKGQRIAVAASDYFEPLGEVVEVQGDDEASLVKVKWGKKTGGKEEWIQAKDLLTKLESKRFNHWKLFGAGWGEPKPVEVSKSGDTILNSELSIVSPDFNPLQTLREARDVLKKDFDNWLKASREQAKDKISTTYLGYYYAFTQGDFFHDWVSVNENEYRARQSELNALDRKINFYEKALRENRAVTFNDLFALELDGLKKVAALAEERETLRAYASVQTLYLGRHPEITPSAFWQKINSMIANGALETALPMVVTSQDLAAIRPDIKNYNRAVSEAIGVKNIARTAFGFVSAKEVDEEIQRLKEIEAKHPKDVQQMVKAQALSHPLVDQLRKNPDHRVVRAYGEFSRALIQGAAQLIDDPSLAIMLVSGVGVAGPLSRGLLTRLVAAGVSERRAKLMALAVNGMLFHAANSSINLGLHQLPGADRSAHIDFSPSGFLHSIAIMGWLGKMQKVYGASVQGYLRFLKARPALQKTLDTIGSKTFETIGLTSFNLGIGTAHNGLEALSPGNIYHELIDSARFTIAYGAMHAGQHIKKGPAQEGFELATKNLRDEVINQLKTEQVDSKKIAGLTEKAKKAYAVFQQEQQEGWERNLRLGQTNLKQVKVLLERQQRLVRSGVASLEEYRSQQAGAEPKTYFDIAIRSLKDQLEVLATLHQTIEKRLDPKARVIAEIERRADKLEPGERPVRTFDKAAMRKKGHRGPTTRQPGKGNSVKVFSNATLIPPEHRGDPNYRVVSIPHQSITECHRSGYVDFRQIRLVHTLSEGRASALVAERLEKMRAILGRLKTEHPNDWQKRGDQILAELTAGDKGSEKDAIRVARLGEREEFFLFNGHRRIATLGWLAAKGEIPVEWLTRIPVWQHHIFREDAVEPLTAGVKLEQEDVLSEVTVEGVSPAEVLPRLSTLPERPPEFEPWSLSKAEAFLRSRDVEALAKAGYFSKEEVDQWIIDYTIRQGAMPQDFDPNRISKEPLLRDLIRQRTAGNLDVIAPFLEDLYQAEPEWVVSYLKRELARSEVSYETLGKMRFCGAFEREELWPHVQRFSESPDKRIRALVVDYVPFIRLPPSRRAEILLTRGERETEPDLQEKLRRHLLGFDLSHWSRHPASKKSEVVDQLRKGSIGVRLALQTLELAKELGGEKEVWARERVGKVISELTAVRPPARDAQLLPRLVPYGKAPAIEMGGQQEVIVGRENFAMDDTWVSRRHFRIIREGDKFFIEDLESQNGTFIAASGKSQRKVVGRVPLKPGNWIFAGDVAWVFDVEAKPKKSADPKSPPISGGSDLPDVSSIYGQAIFHVIGPENSLRRDLVTLCKDMTEIGPEEFKRILRGLMTIVKIRLEQRIPSALEQAQRLNELLDAVGTLGEAHTVDGTLIYKALHDAWSTLSAEAGFLEADQAIEKAAREFQDRPAPPEPRGVVRANGKAVAVDVAKGEIDSGARRRLLSDEQVVKLKTIVHDARLNPQVIENPNARKMVDELEAAIQTGDPIQILQALAQLPDIMVDQVLSPEAGRHVRRIQYHRDTPAFQKLLGELFILAHQQIQGGEAPMTELELAAALNQAGWLGPEAKPERVSKKLSLRSRLQTFGFSHDGDWLTTLKKVLQQPKYQLGEVGSEHQVVEINPEYDQLVKGLVSHIEKTEPDRGGAELNGLLNQHGRDGFGRRKLFPKTEAFFKMHGWDRYFNPEDPLKMLDHLVYPDAPWLHGDTTGFDPVGKAGYARAVRELAKAVILAHYLQEPQIGQMGVYWFPFGKIELTPLTPITRRELLRFLQGSNEAIEARINRWQDNGNGEPAEPRAHGTVGVVYHRDVRGGRTSGLQKRERPASEHGWEWAKMDDLGKGPVGRFYLGVRAEHAKTFWETLKAEVLTAAQSHDLKFQAKISNDPNRLETSGDATVVYFQAKDQRFFYDLVVQFIRRHQGEGWFHTLEMDRRPILAAQVVDPEGRAVAGLSFGQDPKGYTSFNELRAQAITRALRGERLLAVLGVLKNLGPEARQSLRMNLILLELKRCGVDPENPAFQKDGVQQFPLIYLHTDQGFAKEGKTPVSGTRKPVSVSGGSGLPDVSSVYGRALVHVIEVGNLLRPDLEILCARMEAIGPNEFKEIIGGLLLRVKIRIENRDPKAGEQAHTLDLLIRRSHGNAELHPLLEELFQQPMIAEADRKVEVAAREFRNRDSRSRVQRGGKDEDESDNVVTGEIELPPRILLKQQRGVLETLVVKGKKWRMDTTRLDAAMSSDDPIKILRALAELQPIPEYVDGAKGPDDAFLGTSHRADPTYQRVLVELVALALGQIQSGRSSLTQSELEVIAKRAGWEEEAQPLPKPPLPRTTLSLSSRGAGFADPHFAQRVVDSVRSQFLRDMLRGQLLSEDMEPDGRGGQRVANGRLGELLYGAFGTLIMPAMYGGEEGTQEAVTSALVELVDIIESVRLQGIEVDVDPEYWRAALDIVGR